MENVIQDDDIVGVDQDPHKKRRFRVLETNGSHSSLARIKKSSISNEEHLKITINNHKIKILVKNKRSQKLSVLDEF